MTIRCKAGKNDEITRCCEIGTKIVITPRFYRLSIIRHNVQKNILYLNERFKIGFCIKKLN